MLSYIKDEQRNHAGWYWNQKCKFHFLKNPLLIDDVHIDKTLISALLVIKIVKKFSCYVFCLHKWVDEEDVLMKLNVRLFDRRW